MSYLLKSENRAITTVSALSEKRRVMITDCLSDTPACLLHNTQRKRNINRHIRPASSNINYDDRSFETSFKI